MTPDSPKSPREELEARLTALLLGELSAEEAAALRQAIGQDAELARLENQLKETIGLVRQATASKEEKTVEPATPLQLSAERREKLLASFKTTRLEIPKKPRRKFRLRLNRELLKLAAMLVALLLVGGVVLSYFTTMSMREMTSVGGELDEGSFLAGVPARDSSPAQVTTINGRLSFEPSDSPAGGVSTVNASSTTPRSGRDAGASALERRDVYLITQNERANAQTLAQIAKQPEPIGVTNALTWPSSPASRPEPANQQLAQNAERFRTTIALPTAGDSQAPGATPSDSFGDSVANGVSFGRRPEQAGEEYASVSVAGGGGRRGPSSGGALGGQGGVDFGSSVVNGDSKLQVEALHKEDAGRGRPAELADARRRFGGGGGVGGGMGGSGPVTASGGKDNGRIPNAGIPNVSGTSPSLPALGEAADSKASGLNAANFNWAAGTNGTFTRLYTDLNRNGAWAGETFGLGNRPPLATNFAYAKPSFENWEMAREETRSAGDVNGPAPAPTQTAVGRESSRANPVPAIDPATGLSVASTATGRDPSRMHFWDTTFDPVETPASPPAVVPAQPAPTPAAQPRPAGGYYFGQPSDDLGGLKTFKNPTQEGEAPAPTLKGLPILGNLLRSGTEPPHGLTPNSTAAPSTGLPVASPAASVVVNEVLTHTDGPLEDAIELRNRGAIRSIATPAETPAPAQKPDAAKTTSFPDNMDMALVAPETNFPTVTTFSTFLAADPTPNPGGGRELGFQQKLDLDGDSASRLDRLKDLTQKESKQRDSREGDRAWLNPRNPHFGNASQDDSRWNFGAVFDAKRLPQTVEAKPDPVADLAQPLSKEKALAGVQDKLGKVDRADAPNVHSVNAVGDVNQNVAGATINLTIAPPVVDEERKKESEALITRNILAQRTNGSAGDVTVYYGTNGTLGQVIAGGQFAGMNASTEVSEDSLSRRSRTEIALPPGGANVQAVEREPRISAEAVTSGGELPRTIPTRPIRGTQPQMTASPDQVQNDPAPQYINMAIQKQQMESRGRPMPPLPPIPGFDQDGKAGERTAGINASTGLSEDSLSRRSRTEIALPPGGANVQAVEREPRMQAGPIVINEINYNPPVPDMDQPPAPGRGRYARRLNQPAERPEIGVTNRLQFSGKAEEAGVSAKPQDLSRLKNANLSQVLEEYGRLSGRKVIAAGALPPTGGITVESGTALSDKEALNVLDTVLAMNQISTTLQGTTFVKAVPATQAAQEAEKFNDIPWDLVSEAGQVVTRVVKLNNALPKDVAQVIQPFARMPAGIVTVPNSSMIVMRDKAENVERMVEMVRRVDVVPVQEFIDVVIPLKTAPATDVARMLQNSAATGELAAAGRAKIIADERTNSLLVFAGRNDLDSISNVIRRLDAPIPQGEVETAENAFSTFSLNVSDVSFKLAAASLEKGQMPDVASVRSEEFINAFDYRDPEPKGSAPIAFAWERARYPFAHNRDLLRFSVKTAASGRQPGRPLNLVLLLDNSGSMERADRVRVIRECVRVLAGQLRPEDRVSVVAFARTARLVVDGFSGSNAGNLPEVIGQLAPDGGTNLEDAMNVAYQAALKHFLPNGVNRVVLLTDGAANLGDVEPESLKKKVEAHRKQGVALDCFGIGWDGYNDDLLEVLSRNGDGRYGFVNTPEAAASEFAGQLAGALRVAASDVKVQVEFNPRRVTVYRQIGYAKHQLKKEQFRDNTVDAAEIGAAEQGNALYTVQVNPNGEGPLGVVRVRFKVPGTSDYREHEWALPYSGAATPLEQCSPALRLAATASAFSEWLVSSPFAAEVTPDRLLGYLSGVPESSAADPRPKKLEWMIRQARSLAGK